MPNNLDIFEKEIKDSIEKFQPKYSKESWNEISKQLPKAKPPYFKLIAATVVGLAVISFVMVKALKSDDKPNTLASLPSTEVNTATKINADLSQKAIKEQVKKEAKHPKQSTTKELSAKQEAPAEKLVQAEHTEAISPKKSNKQTKENEEAKKRFENNEAEKNIRLKPVLLAANKQKGCAPLEVRFAISNTVSNSSWLCICENEFKQRDSSFTYLFTKAGNYTVILIDSVQDNKKTIQQIEVYPQPQSTININKEEDKLLVNSTNNNSDLVWYLDKAKEESIIGSEAEFKLQHTGDYTIHLLSTNEYSCKNHIVKTIHHKIEHHIFAPTAFTPNGDGNNDNFILKYKIREDYNYLLEIRDLKGKLVFESQDPQEGWDAKNVDFTQNQAFIWQLIISNPNGEKEIKTGRFKLLVK